MKRSTIWLLGIIGFVLICFCCLFFKIPSIEDDLLTRTNNALSEAGIKIDNLSISGRNITLAGIVESENVKGRAVKIAKDIWGNNSVYNALKVNKLEEPSNVELIQKKLDETIELTNIEFETGNTIIKPKSFSILSNVADILIKNPEIAISVNGHTDSKGNPELNTKLSKQRAESVKRHLVKRGVENNRIYINGYGSSRPIADNNTVEGRQKNRRVEFKIKEEN
jgi:outer membrane protein OmpA-like peptidoglycan-associated protein